MREREELHVDESLQAWLDGELDEAEAHTVRRHVEECDRCSRAVEELRAVRSVLGSDADLAPLRPMWPAVKARMVAETRPRFGLSFGFATSAAAVAGLIIGLALGGNGDVSQRTAATGDEESVLGDDALATLDEIYVSLDAGEGETR